MKNNSRLLILAMILLAKIAWATDIPETSEIWNLYSEMKSVGAALGALVIVYAGLRWIMAENPQDRDDAKKAVIYTIVGLLVIAVAKEIVDAIYCGSMAGDYKAC